MIWERISGSVQLKARYEDYTETEFLEFLNEFFHSATTLEGDDFGRYISQLARHFATITEHPDEDDLIFHPPKGMVHTPAGILAAVKEWRSANGKAGFKAA